MEPKSMKRLNRRNFDLSIFHSFKFDGLLGCMEGGNKQDFDSMSRKLCLLGQKSWIWYLHSKKLMWNFTVFFPAARLPTNSRNFLRWNRNPNQNGIIPYK